MRGYLAEREDNLKSTTTIGNYLIRRLQESGIAHIFGMPGDYNLGFLEQVLAHDGIEWIGACNELNAAYAADGYARVNGTGALLVTYGVGDLSALNGIAGAYAEHVPLICISGTPPLQAIRHRMRLHHTSGERNFEDVMACMAQFTAAQARISPFNATTEIDRLIRIALREKRPVYLQLPSDIPYIEIESPAAAIGLSEFVGDVRQTEHVVQLIAGRIMSAKRPALLVDVDANRFSLRVLICGLAERYSIPFATTSSGKGVLNEHHPLYCGVYAGQGSAPSTIEIIEGADCLITVGVRFFDANTCIFSQNISASRTIVVDPFHVAMDGNHFEGVTAGKILSLLVERLPRREKAQLESATTVEAAVRATPEQRLTHADLWPRIERFLQPKDIVIAENGTSHAGLMGVTLPSNATFISQAAWGSIGFTLPALLGTLLAAPGSRHLLFIGDGSFQLTMQELSTILRLGLKPIIFLINNHGYTIERVILGPESAYNDIQRWTYRDILRAFADGQEVGVYTVTFQSELHEVLEQVGVTDRLNFVEIILDKFDAPIGLKRMGPRIRNLDFGEPELQERLDSVLLQANKSPHQPTSADEPT